MFATFAARYMETILSTQ